MECTVDYQNKQVSFSSVLVRIKFEHCLSETCRSRFEKISNNLLLKVSYRFFLHNLLVFFSLLLSSCLVSKSYCGTKNTETRPFHRWSMGNETAIAVSVKKHGWLCERVVIGVLLDPFTPPCEVASEY